MRVDGAHRPESRANYRQDPPRAGQPQPRWSKAKKAEKTEESVGVAGGVARSGRTVAVRAVLQEKEDFAGAALSLEKEGAGAARKSGKRMKMPESPVNIPC